ncbi:MAG: transposase [Candidatus Omnitrophica bacterium]|nr:transposase [Candidatus Omnitrophota bacterium]
MAREGRIYFCDAVYHISIRGNNRQDVLGSVEDKKIFLESLSKFKLRFGFKLYGLVLMDNHVHLVIRATNGKSISKIMQAIILSFSVKFRKKHNYSGYVWQGRFKSKVIDSDLYIVKCLEYVHNNPIRSGLVNSIKDYPWSSYHFYNNLRNPIQDYLTLDLFSE